MTINCVDIRILEHSNSVFFYLATSSFIILPHCTTKCYLCTAAGSIAAQFVVLNETLHERQGSPHTQYGGILLGQWAGPPSCMADVYVVACVFIL